jgi:hypothetical protein
VAGSTSYQYSVDAVDAAGNASAVSDTAAVQTPPTALFRDGFESGDLSQWGSATGLVVQRDETFAGNFAARATTTGTAAYATKTLAVAQAEVFEQLRVKVVSQAANSVVLTRLRTATGGGLVKLYLDSSGRLAYRNDVAGTTSTSSSVVRPGGWHTVQLHTLINGASGQVDVWLDGVKLSALSKAESLGTTPIGRVQLGDDATARTYDVAYDDVVLDTSFLDGVAPAVTLSQPADGSSTADATPTFSGDAGTATGDADTVRVKVYAGTDLSAPALVSLTATQSQGTWSVDATDALADGTYTARAEQSDAAGNVGLSAAHTFTISTL